MHDNKKRHLIDKPKEKKHAKKYRFIINLVIFLVSISGLIYFFKNINLDLLLANISKINIFYVAIATLLIIFILFLKILRLYFLLPKKNTNISFLEITSIQSLTILFAMITPMRAGEFTKIYFFNKKGLNLIDSTSIVFIERITDISILLAFSLIFIFNFNFSFLIKISVLLALLACFLIFFNMGMILPFLKDRIKFMKNLHVNLSFKESAGLLFLTFIIWFIDTLILSILLINFGIRIDLFYLMGVIGIATFAAIFSILPSGLGTMDFSFSFLLLLRGVQGEVILVILIILRILGLFVHSFLALISNIILKQVKKQ
jgi:glycosyltransferase 2 family protein